VVNFTPRPIYPREKIPGNQKIADKTKYMIMSRDQNAGRSHSMRTDNSSIESVEEFKCLGTTLTNQNSIQEEIKSRLKLGNACWHTGHWPRCLLSKKSVTPQQGQCKITPYSAAKTVYAVNRIRG
jgi:hypothetical protein